MCFDQFELAIESLDNGIVFLAFDTPSNEVGRVGLGELLVFVVVVKDLSVEEQFQLLELIMVLIILQGKMLFDIFFQNMVVLFGKSCSGEQILE